MDNEERPAFGFDKYFADVFTDNAEEKHLNAGEEGNGHDNRRPSGYRIAIPPVPQTEDEQEETEKAGSKAKENSEFQRSI